MKEENFPHTFLVSYPLTDRVRGELGNLRGERSETGALKAKQRKFTTEITPNVTSQLQSSLHVRVCPQRVGAECRGSGLRGRSIGTGPGLTAMKIL